MSISLLQLYTFYDAERVRNKDDPSWFILKII